MHFIFQQAARVVYIVDPNKSNTTVILGDPRLPPIVSDTPAAPGSVDSMLRMVLRNQKTMQAHVAELPKENNITHIKLDAANRRIVRQEALLKEMATAVTRNGADLTPPTTSQDNPARNADINEGIPDDSQLDLETLRVMNTSSNNPGHLACLFVKKFFPELFLSGRNSEYNWFWGGVKVKRELECRRKHIIERYVTYFHPEVRDPLMWRDRVVNQFIERPLKKKNSNAPIQEEHEEEMNQETDDQISTVGPLTALLYTDF